MLTYCHREPVHLYAATCRALECGRYPDTQTLPPDDADSPSGSRLRVDACHREPFQWKTLPAAPPM
jgi:hypothetical protein